MKCCNFHDNVLGFFCYTTNLNCDFFITHMKGKGSDHCFNVESL